MKNKKVKIYIKPYHTEMIKTDTGFDLHIFGATNNGDGKQHEIIINFNIWWIRYFLKDFKKILNEKIAYLKSYLEKINIE